MTGTFGAEASTLVQLIDRRTGAVHRVDGRPVAAWVPAAGIADSVSRMMAGRDPGVWTVRVMEMAPAQAAKPAAVKFGTAAPLHGSRRYDIPA